MLVKLFIVAFVNIACYIVPAHGKGLQVSGASLLQSNDTKVDGLSAIKTGGYYDRKNFEDFKDADEDKVSSLDEKQDSPDFVDLDISPEEFCEQLSSDKRTDVDQNEEVNAVYRKVSFQDFDDLSLEEFCKQVLSKKDIDVDHTILVNRFLRRLKENKPKNNGGGGGGAPTRPKQGKKRRRF